MQEDQEEIEYEPEYSRINNEALVRIEKAKLYQLLLQNELFGEDAGDQEAIDQVTEEIKDFVLARLETLIGMRSGNESVSTPAKLPWTTHQITALTQLADRLIAIESKPPMVQTPSKPTVNTITKAKPAVPKQAPQPAPQKVQSKPRPRPPATSKPLIGNSTSVAPVAPLTEKKIGDDRAYSKTIDNPKRRPMPSAMEMQAMALSQVTVGLDFVSQGSGPEDARKVGNLLLGNMAPSIESVKQGID